MVFAVRFLSPLFLLAIIAVTAHADDVTTPSPSINFEKQIAPLFKKHCASCHEGKKRRGGLSLSNRQNATALADSGKSAIVPGKSAQSELIRRVQSNNDDERMPPRGERLSSSEIALLKNWIDQGANWSPTTTTVAHWAYRKPVRPELPEVKHQAWPKNAIDYFILAQLEKKNWQSSAETERARLIRRVYLDLIGIPPTVAQVDAFLKDTRPDAYERVVDQLLASPHYGERWATHWLDLARYADSNGFQRDGFREVWPYRDWVVQAFNKDMSFREFTIAQIGGDLLPQATLDQKIATGFNRCTTVNVEAGVDREEDRVNAIFDRVNTTATVWLGTTMVCGQCHNHKYDPFTQKDYYQLFAFFNNTASETKEGSGANREFIGPKVALPLTEEQAKKKAALDQQRQKVNARLNQIVKNQRSQFEDWEKNLTPAQRKKLPKEVKNILKVESEKRNKNQQQKLFDFFSNRDPEAKKQRDQLKSIDNQLAKLAPVETLVMQELPEPRKTHIFKRGSFLDKLQPVQPDVPQALHPFPENAPRNRLGLAMWLVDEDNPLVARVTVNRWWAEFFGQGLVESLEDFGSQSQPPTHPQLLDWLATEFVRSGWSMKAVHRLIVTSATYRQDNRVTPEELKKDPENQFYARGPRLRLSAEFVRDNALAIAGLLSDKMAGPPVFPPQPAGLWNVTGRVDNTYRTSKGEDRFRRGLYTIRRRSSPYPSFSAFDSPDRSACVVNRPRTNTPLQALTLMNDAVYVEAAIAFGDRVLREKPKATLQERLRHGFRMALARQPSGRELEILEQIYGRAHERYRSDPAKAQQLLSNSSVRQGHDPVELASWFQIGTVLLNLDETITK